MKKFMVLGLVIVGVVGSFNGCVNQAPKHSTSKYMDEREKKCNDGNADGCNGLGLTYGFIGGAGITKDYSKAAKYYEKACDLGMLRGCYNVGRIYGNGMYGMHSKKGPIAVKPDKVKAKIFFKKACDGKNSNKYPSNKKYALKGCKYYNKMK